MLSLILAAHAAPAVHDPQRPLAIGSRAGVWTGPYTSPALGGHVKLRASRLVGLEGFADHTLRVASGTARHDHVLGFSAYTPLLGTERWFVSPTLGSCVDFRVDTPLTARVPGRTDVLFGAHTGAMAEVALGGGWSLETTATAFAYVGNSAGSADWTDAPSRGLRVSAVGQVLGSVNVTL